VQSIAFWRVKFDKIAFIILKAHIFL
jgi:hypothetical protein